MVRGFELGENVTENVIALRKALGSVAKPLSYADFAKLLVREGHPRKTLNASTVYDWTRGAEPDIASIRVMADIAGVPFELFALGRAPRVEIQREVESERDITAAHQKPASRANAGGQRRGHSK